MSDDLVKRLRDWEHVWIEDADKPEGSLYLTAADRIEKLEAENADLKDKLAKAVNFGDELAYQVEYGLSKLRGMNSVQAWDSFTAELTGDKDE